MSETTTPKTLEEMTQALENKMLEVLLILENRYKTSMPIPKIEFKPRIGLQLGFAERATNKVVMNMDLCNEKHWHIILNEVLPHEVCHLVAPKIYNRWRHGIDKNQGWSHGNAWKECMVSIGLPPNTRHAASQEMKETLQVRKVKKNFVYGCPCGKTFELTALLHNRIQTGQKRHCLTCKGTVTFKGYKA